jgi:hypothetical protein
MNGVATQPTGADLRWEKSDSCGTIRVAKPGRWNDRFDAATATLAPEDDAWRRYLVVIAVPQGSALIPTSQPPVLGSYRRDQGDLVFTTRFPLATGVTYHAYFDPSGKEAWSTKTPGVAHSSLALPKMETTASTLLERIYPTTNVLPENQLKLYLHFSAPMSQGEAYRHVRLVKENGEEVRFPFLELGEELWDPTGKRFTLFFDPGRIKRGLKPREEMGPALEAGQRYVLVVDAAWRDADGNPLQKEFRKAFQVGPPDDLQPDPKAWKFTYPVAGTRDPLVVAFPEPLDHGLLGRLLQVVTTGGEVVQGKIAIAEEEKRWQFVPDHPWSAQTKYELQVTTYLEDLAGNSIAKPFEVDVFEKVEQETKPEIVKLPIEVRPAP